MMDKIIIMQYIIINMEYIDPYLFIEESLINNGSTYGFIIIF